MYNKLYCIVCWSTYSLYGQMKFTFVQNYYSCSILRNSKFHVGDIMLCYAQSLHLPHTVNYYIKQIIHYYMFRLRIVDIIRKLQCFK